MNNVTISFVWKAGVAETWYVILDLGIIGSILSGRLNRIGRVVGKVPRAKVNLPSLTEPTLNSGRPEKFDFEKPEARAAFHLH